MKHVNAFGKELNPAAYQQVFEALNVAAMQIEYELMSRVHQEVEKKAKETILLAAKKAIAYAEEEN